MVGRGEARHVGEAYGEMMVRGLWKRAGKGVSDMKPPDGRKWISVTERYPDNARDVLTWSETFGQRTGCFEWGAEDDPCWWTDEGHTAAFKESVTHWAEVGDGDRACKRAGKGGVE